MNGIFTHILLIEDELPPDDEDDFTPPPPDDSFGLDDLPEPDEDDEPAPPDDSDLMEEDVLPFDDEDLLDDLDDPPLPEDPENDEPPLEDIDLPPLPPSPPPQPKSKTPFSLPVRKPNSLLVVEEVRKPSIRAPIDLGALTAGLAVREPPQLLRRSVASTVSVGGSVASASTYGSVPPPPGPPPPSAPVKTADTASKALADGYETCQGKFDTDPFEMLYVKVSKEDKRLTVMIESGEELGFDLSAKAFLFEDTAQSNTIVLDYHTNIIIFQFPSTESLIAFMKNMPEEVFLAPDAPADDALSTKAEEAKKKPPVVKSPAKKGAGPKIDHVKGTSVEDILENDFEASAARQDKLDQMFTVKETITMHYPPAPMRRKELVETYIRKPKYSVRRGTLLCEWINSLHVWAKPLSILVLHKEMCNGLLLARIVKHLNPEVQFVHLNEKPLAKKAAMDNLDQALGHIWRSKSLNNSRIPTALDIYSGKTSKIAVLVNEVFSVYIAKPMYKQAIKVLRWYNAVLKQYSRPLPQYVFDEGDLSAVWPHFQSGTALFCILFHFYGSIQLKKGMRVDPLQVCGDPSSICEYRDNLLYVFSLLEALGIDILWTVEDWISYPDTEFIMLQLIFIYETLKTKQCSLPPAQGSTPGITSGPNGELLVVGLAFKDAPLNSKYLPKVHKAVLLGYDRDSMPLLPIDKVVKNARFTSHGILPGGMTHNAARLQQVSVDLKECRIHADKGQWNARTTVRTEKDTFEGAHLVNLLREHHKAPEADVSSNLSVTSNPTSRGQTSASATHVPGRRVSALHAAVRTLGVPHSPVKDIDGLVAALDKEMTAAHAQLTNHEEALANQYLDLEANAQDCSLEEYQRILEHLEGQRVELEREKARLQDHFQRKLALIKARRDDVFKATYSQQQQAFNELAATTRGSALNVSQLSPTKTKPKPAKTIEQAEKGWLKLSSAKQETHNYHLRNRQAAGNALFQTKITPQKLRMKESQRMAPHSPSRGGASPEVPETDEIQLSLQQTYQRSKVPLSAEEQVQDSFQRFKQRLASASSKWQASRHKHRTSLMESIASPPRVQTSEHIALPEKSFAPVLMTKEEQVFAHALREGELQCMHYEDERRRMVLAEASLQANLHDPAPFAFPQYMHSQDKEQSSVGSPQWRSVASPPPADRDRDQSSREPSKAYQQSQQPSAVEIDAAFRWLSASRPLVICDRKQAEYVFALADHHGDGHRGFMQYALEWREFSSYTSTEVLAGCVLLEDIAVLSPHANDPELFSLTLVESTRSLKNAKGRTNLVIRCAGQNDCLKYINALTILLAVR